jgi:rRNA processing protein Gar1
VLHISSSRRIILKAQALPRIGDEVIDENLKRVGTVFDIFGSVTSPYLAVRSERKELQCLVGSVLYAVPSSSRRKEKGKYGR